MEDGAGLSSGEGVYQLSDKESSIYSQSLYFRVATSLAHVEGAWRLVYQRYVQTGLIESNPLRLHTSTHAVQRGTCVVLGESAGCIESTLTLISDSARGLSLDRVYSRELKALRSARRTLLEVGLLADRCSGRCRGMAALFEMMKWAAYYARHLDLSDIVIGVHPHHVKFYSRCFSFEQFGPQSVCPMVKNKPVVPLRLRLNEQLAKSRLPRGLRYVRDNPLDAEVFATRYDFREQTFKDSAVERFMTFQRRKDVKTGSRPIYSLSKTLRKAFSDPITSLAEPANP